MSPYPARVDREDLIRTARNMVEEHGAENLSLSNLAAAFGVKTPSLYNHIDNKAALLQAINTLTMREMMAFVMLKLDAVSDEHPRKALLAAANAYRDYAYAHPRAYLLLYASDDPEMLPDSVLARELVLPIEARFVEMTAEPEEALHALRGLWALMHGFVTLELAGQFRRTEASVGQAWQRALEVYLDGWQ